MNNKSRSVLLNIIWMVFDRVFLLILGVFVTVQVANYFGAEEYGKYQYAISIVAILELFMTFVDPRVVKKKYFEMSADTVVYNATVVRVIFSLIASMCGALYIFCNTHGHEFNAIFFVLLLNTIVINLRFGLANRFEFLLKSKTIVIANDVAALLSSILQLVAVHERLSIFFISVIALVSSVVNLLILYIQYRKVFGLLVFQRINWNLIKYFVSESTPLAIAASCAILYTRCGSVMLGSMLSMKDVGIYAISEKLVGIAAIVLGPIRESVYPGMIELYRKDTDLYEKTYVKITCALNWLCILGIVISFVVLPYFFRYLKPQYADAFNVYMIHVFSVFFMYNAALRAGHLTLIKRGDVLMYSQFFSIVINVFATYFFISSYGIYGAAIAIVVTQAISLLLSNCFFGNVGWDLFIWQIKSLNPMYMFR